MRLARLSAILLAAVCAVPQHGLEAGTFTVTTTDDSGAGSLRQTLVDVNAAGGGTINVTTGGLVILASPLPILSTPITLNGNNLAVSGNNQFRGFFIDAPPGTPLTINNLAIVDGKAKGGNGGDNHGGGGGLGAGGGVFLSSGSLTLTNVTFINNAAVGGKGGNATININGGGTQADGGGGGGGLGGNGGFVNGGGGGLLGSGGGGTDFQSGGGGGGTVSSGSGSTGSQGGAGGGAGGTGPTFGGGAAPSTGGGGGGSLTSSGTAGSATAGGNGGRFGGGGGSQQLGGNGGDFGGGGGSSTHGGNGGFGGGGGGANTTGGNGGFGGGGGGTRSGSPGVAGAFGGAGSGAGPLGDYGGGGAALGAHLFVRAGATLTLIDSSADAGTLTPGLGGGQPFSSGGAGNPGQTDGSSFFLAGPTTFSVSSGQSRTIGGAIGDVGKALGDPSAAGFALAILTKTGPGALAFTATNTYGGGTVVSQGTLTANSVGPGAVTLNDANSGSIATAFLVGANVNFANPITVANLGTGGTTIGSANGASGPTVFTGAIVLNKSVTVLAQNSAPLDIKNELGQTRLDGSMTGVGGITITGGHMVQFRAAAKTYTGPTIVTGNSTLSLYSSASTPVNSTVQVDAGSTVILEGLTNGAIGGLSGAGALANNPAWSAASVLQVGSNNADTAFTGQITSGLNLTKTGTGTLDLGAQNNTSLQLTIASGRLRLAGDQHIGALSMNSASAGTQAIDLAGHEVQIFTGGLAGISTESSLNQMIGTAADGIYDSTAASHPRSRIGITFLSGSGQPLRMKLTIAGDANLDGVVNFSDLVKVAQNYGGGDFSAFWDDGDFNYDHKVDFSDLVVIAQNYGGAFSSAPIPGASADFERDVAAAFASVPEPGLTGASAVGGIALMVRRRQRLQAVCGV